MSETKHTPGPWELTEIPDNEGGGPVYRIQGRTTLFLHLSECSDGYVPGENEANARLIVKSPDLLAMLRRVRETCHLGEDDTLGPDIDRLIAEATGQPVSVEEGEDA